MNLSIIIAYHGEGKEFICETLNQIRETCDTDYEIIIVDDCSEFPLKLVYNDNTTVIRHKENKGVGASFDTGVKAARSRNLFLMGCDVRFTNNNWASKMVKEIESYPDSLICTSVVSLSQSLFDVMKTLPPEVPYYNDSFNFAKHNTKYDLFRGASILFYMGGNGNPHHIIEAQWMPREFLPLRRPDYIAPTECFEVPCILGAAYGTTKKWYSLIDGFWGHRFWGTLEPYISMKSWLMGGRCLVAPMVETAHIFNDIGIHADQYKYGLYKSYNRMLVATLLFSDLDSLKLMTWLPDKDYVSEAMFMIVANGIEIKQKRDEYREKFKMSMEEFVTKFGLKL